MLNFEVDIRDLNIYLELTKVMSVREVARRQSLSPSQVSKSIQKIESALGTKLFDRTAKGVSLTPPGRRAMKHFSTIIKEIEKLAGEKESPTTHEQRLGIGSVSFLASHLLPQVVADLFNEFKKVKWNILEVAPDQMSSAAMRGAFDVALHLSPISWPSTWFTKRIGEMSWHLCARKGHPVLSDPSLQNILSYSFITPIYWTYEGLHEANDFFPNKKVKRAVAHQTSTAETAINLVSVSDSLSYLPDVLIRRYENDGLVERVTSKEMPPTQKPLFLSVRADLISTTLLARLTEYIQVKL